MFILYFKSITSTVYFCFFIFDINFGHLRIQYSVPIFTQECDDYSLPLLTLLFLPQITSISSLFLFFSIQFCESLWVFWAMENTLGTELRRSVSLLLSPPFSPPAHLYLPPPSPLLHVTLWTSLGFPHGGESFHH